MIIADPAVLFDMDGVLVDSEPIHKEADVAVFRTVGLEVPVEVLQEYAGTGADVFFSAVLRRFGVAGDVATLRAEKNRFLAELLRENAPAVPGALDLLSRVEGLGWKKAVASSSDEAIVGLVLERMGIAGRFEAVVTGDRVSRGKPAPDVFLAAAQALAVAPGRCVVVEDAGSGVAAALAAGMRCIGFQNPLSGNQDLSRAHRIVKSLDEVDAALLRSVLAP